jgi:chromosome segregation protein
MVFLVMSFPYAFIADNMYLKALNVHGFKSFAEPTKIEFHKGITAIVGPNGCGKSNVLDSIRWVLGEQSAKALRGGQMQDVIFNGSENRKPLSMAEVSLTFGDCENTLQTEYNEITITRRLFRDGSSEYEINKQPCRLRDIQQTFMDTGIGRSSYSIMEQGKIDLILSAKPEDRRAIFEEAAGITRYKSQRKEALRKLEHAEANITILDTQIQEVSRQLGSLQRQASKAKRYQELLEELKGLELKVGKHQFDEIQTELSQFQAQLQDSSSHQTSLEQQIEGQEGGLNQVRLEVEELELGITGLRDVQNTHRITQQKSIQRIQNNESRIVEYQQLQDQAQLEVASVEEKIRIQEESLQHLGTQLEELQSIVSNTETACLEKEESFRTIDQKRQGIDLQRAEKLEFLGTVQNQLLQIREQTAALELQQRNFLFRLENLKTEQGLLEQRRQQNDARSQEVQVLLQSTEESLQSLKSRRSSISETLQNIQSEFKGAQNQLDEAKKALQTKEAQKSALSEIVIKRSKVAPDLQQVLSDLQSPEFQLQLSGLLSDHFQVHSGYEKAISLLLGENAQALIIENLDQAKPLIQALHSREMKQVTLALREMSRPQPVTLLQEAAHALLKVEAQAEILPLLKSLLEYSFVTGTLEEALEIKQRYPESTIATVQGDLITSQGFVKVGCHDAATYDLFLRQNEIRSIDLELHDLVSNFETHQNRFETLQDEVSRLQAEYQQIQESTHEQEIEVTKHRQSNQALEETGIQIERQVQTLLADVNRLIAQDQADQEKLQNLHRERETLTVQIQGIQGESDALSRQLEDLVLEEGVIRQELSELKVQLATQAQQRDHLAQQQQQSNARIHELNESLSQRRLSIEEYGIRVQTSRDEIAQAMEEQNQSEVQIREMEDQLNAKCEMKSGLQSTIQEQEMILRNFRRELSDIQSKRSTFEVAITQREMRLNALRERFEHHYQLSLENLPALEEESEPSDWALLDAEVTEKRQRLDNMGPVNLDSIAEYEDLEKHHQNLVNQITDLRNSREQLLEAIKKINETTKTLFSETFEKVKANFQQTFTELFGGGTARLVLQDENDPLECGIDIIAKPPGKQPQSITLLSGGEKTMTAVALLFALYQVKPSPFCVLDEMDAPLDESNINRFIKMLKRFLSNSQFVVITHNKRTISVADALYGVTMQERGASSILSYRLNKHEEQDKSPEPHPRLAGENREKDQSENLTGDLALSTSPVVETPESSGPTQN